MEQKKPQKTEAIVREMRAAERAAEGARTKEEKARRALDKVTCERYAAEDRVHELRRALIK